MDRKTLILELQYAIGCAVAVFIVHSLVNETDFSPELKLVLTLVVAMPFFMQLLVIAGLVVFAGIAGFGWLDDRLSDWVDKRVAACELKERL